MRQIMIDLETMSLRPTAAIVAIGAARIVNGTITDTFYTPVAIDSCVQAGLHVDPSTVVWWMQQSTAARQVFVDPPMTLPEALARFRDWMTDSCPLWGNGATADNVWLRNAYAAIHQPAPWSYKHDRCYRTMKELMRDICPEPDDESEESKHNALWDAHFQAKHLITMQSVYAHMYDSHNRRSDA